MSHSTQLTGLFGKLLIQNAFSRSYVHFTENIFFLYCEIFITSKYFEENTAALIQICVFWGYVDALG